MFELASSGRAERARDLEGNAGDQSNVPNRWVSCSRISAYFSLLNGFPELSVRGRRISIKCIGNFPASETYSLAATIRPSVPEKEKADGRYAVGSFLQLPARRPVPPPSWEEGDPGWLTIRKGGR